MMAPLVVHFLISLMFVVNAVSSTAQWKTLRPVDMTRKAVDGQTRASRRRRRKRINFRDRAQKSYTKQLNLTTAPEPHGDVSGNQIHEGGLG